MTPRNCLSSLELLELRIDGGPATAQTHVDGCARCAALYALFPDGLEAVYGDLATSLAKTSLDLGARLGMSDAPERPERIATGQVFSVEVESGWKEHVVVLGPRRDAPDLVVVAPVSTDTRMAAEADLLVAESPLGYEHLVCVWCSGVVRKTQLARYRGRLGRDLREALAASYRTLTAEGEAATPAGVAPVLGAEDERLVWRDAFQERLRTLYHEVDQLLDEPGHEHLAKERTRERPPAFHAGTRTRTRTTMNFGDWLTSRFDEEGWDEVSLAEKADMTSNEVRSLIAGKFDLDYRRDTDRVATVLRLLAPEQGEIEDVVYGPLKISLELCQGGLVHAEEGREEPIAASSFAIVDDDQRDDDLYSGMTAVDDSAEAHKQAVELYIQDVLAAI